MKGKKQIIIMRLISILFMIMGGVLSVLYQDDKILAIQLYTGLELPKLFYMIGLLILVVSFVWNDIGFFKLAIVIGILAVSLALILFITNNRTRYMLLENDEHRIIVQHTINENNTNYVFFERDTFFTYIKFAQHPKPNTYDSTLTLEGNRIVVEKCDDTYCFYEYVNLD